MKIWGDVPKVLGVYDKGKSVAKTGGTAGVASKKDQLSISAPAKDFQTALKAVKEIPDIRNEKVNELADKYESGTYNVSGNDTADKIIRSMFDSRV